MSAAELRTPLKRARGLGSAKGGTHHFIIERLTALALVPLSLWAIYIALSMMHADYASARAVVQQPFNAICLSAFALAMFWHMQLGLQVIIEDYVHLRWLEVASQIAVKFVCAAGALASVLAIVRIALG